MALKVSGTTVIDDSKNIISSTPHVTGTILAATNVFKIPSVTTANRPASPSTGEIIFDTDEGRTFVYDGTEWK
jgi:hypothetical protein